MAQFRRIVPCLWFEHQAEEAANFYMSLFENSKIVKVTRFAEAGHEFHHQPAGSVMTVVFTLDGQKFTALNGGPEFKFNEAISLQIFCHTQAEIDHFWNGLIAGGGQAGPCGWLKDRFGLSWQVIPLIFEEWITDPDPVKVSRVLQTMFTLTKLDIEPLRRAYFGE